jgi:predicted lipoprotein
LSRASVLVTAALSLAACDDGGPSRAEVLQPIMAEQVPARFEQFATTTDNVRENVEAWCDAGAVTPTVAIDQALTEWYALKPFWSGPVMERRSQYAINFRTDPDGIAEVLASVEPVDAAYLRERVGADKRGLGALQVLTSEPPDPRRCGYALGVAELVAAEARNVADDWAEFGPAAVGDDAAANDAIRDIVSNATFALRDMEMDPPPEPEVASGLLAGVQQAMLGDSEADQQRRGLAPLLPDEISTRLSDELTRGDSTAAELTLSVDVASELGITLNFSDADGDG